MTRSLALILFALSASALEAQQAPLVGTWRISYPAGMRIENGTPTPIMATGTLTIKVQHDSLIGDLRTDPAPGRPKRPRVRLAAATSADTAVFTSHTKATVNINGNIREATAVSTWTLFASGDVLSGTLARTVEGLDAAGSTPGQVTGTRKK